MAELDKQEEEYVQGIVAGLTQLDAYRKAYPLSKRWKDTTVSPKASKLFKEGKIQTRYRDLLREARNTGSNMAIWTREQAFKDYEWLKDKAKENIEEEGVRKANSDAFLSSIDGMNKMAFHDLELADQKLKAEIERIKADTEKTKVLLGEDEETDIDDGFLAALEGKAADVWQDE